MSMQSLCEAVKLNKPYDRRCLFQYKCLAENWFGLGNQPRGNQNDVMPGHLAGTTSLYVLIQEVLGPTAEWPNGRKALDLGALCEGFIGKSRILSLKAEYAGILSILGAIWTLWFRLVDFGIRRK